MARITVEDCIDKFPSRFELVLVASNRARKLHSGDTPTIEKDNDKNTVIALREIAEETIAINDLKNDLIEEYQISTFSEDEDLIEADENIDPNSSNDDSVIEDLNSNEISTDDNVEQISEIETDTTNTKEENELNNDIAEIENTEDSKDNSDIQELKEK